MADVTPPAHKTKVELAYDFLRERILSGELEPARKLTLAGLAQMMGTSHMPVREAVLRLQQEGLIEVTPHTGMRVAPLRHVDVLELFQLRAALEGLAARLAAERLPPNGLRQLEELHKKFQTAQNKSDYGQMAQANWDFHEVILAAAGNAQLARELATIWSKCFRFRAGYRLIPGRSGSTVREHAAILAAFQARDADAASKAAFDHANQAGLDLFHLLSANEEAGDAAPKVPTRKGARLADPAA